MEVATAKKGFAADQGFGIPEGFSVSWHFPEPLVERITLGFYKLFRTFRGTHQFVIAMAPKFFGMTAECGSFG